MADYPEMGCVTFARERRMEQQGMPPFANRTRKCNYITCMLFHTLRTQHGRTRPSSFL